MVVVLLEAVLLLAVEFEPEVEVVLRRTWLEEPLPAAGAVVVWRLVVEEV